ncbi:MAG: ATP-binding protein [Chloroflexales bacterium]|nr:ATP-binding protein [Chloroflexales bacterium]
MEYWRASYGFRIADREAISNDFRFLTDDENLESDEEEELVDTAVAPANSDDGDEEEPGTTVALANNDDGEQEPGAIVALSNGDEEEEAIVAPSDDRPDLVADLLSYCLGVAFGRWDVRYATGEFPMPDLPDPFTPLPAYSPGMLRPEERPRYPYRHLWYSEGIIADDESHSADVVASLRAVLDAIFEDRADVIERELCEALDDRPLEKRRQPYTLRDYLRRSSGGGFWQHHLQRYSKSRRKAPIYWLLQSPKRHYGLWLYYPALTADTLPMALNSYVEPKLRRELDRLSELRGEQQAASGAERRRLDREVERQEELLNDIQTFRDCLERVVRRSLVPDHNDGVLLTIAPLWELVPWSEARKTWEELQAGKYEWSSISRQLRGEYVPPAQIFATDWDAIELDLPEETPVQGADNADQGQRQEQRPWLGWLRMRGIGPADELELTLDERINIFTGDNGLGKTFVLDAAWLALTGTQPPAALTPSLQSLFTTRSEIAFEIVASDRRLLDPDKYVFEDGRWQLSSQLASQKRAEGGEVKEQQASYTPDLFAGAGGGTGGMAHNAAQDDHSGGLHSVDNRPGLVLYAHVDGGFSVWDRLKQERLLKAGLPPALQLTQDELWRGKSLGSLPLCRGLFVDLTDWTQAAHLRADRAAAGLPDLEGEAAWQATLFDSMNSILAQLTPGDGGEPGLALGSPMRLNTIDATLYPTVAMGYGQVPIVHASAAVKRVLSLVYALLWAWDEHQREAVERGLESGKQIVLLIDEVELHLHPKWQRLVFAMLRTAISQLGDEVNAQLLVTTHAPLVLASLEPHFEEERDQLFDFEWDDDRVALHPIRWAKYGDTSSWLRSPIFGLKSTRSISAEAAIDAAEALLASPKDTNIATLEAVHQQLQANIPDEDVYWDTWFPFYQMQLHILGKSMDDNDAALPPPEKA